MRKFIILILSLVFYGAVNNCFAQDIGQGIFKREKKPKTTAPVSPKTTAKPAEKNTRQTLTLTSNEDCTIRIDDKDHGSLRRGEKKAISLEKGTYTLTATSFPAAYLYETRLSIVDSAILLHIDLSKIIIEARRKLDSLNKSANDKNVQ